MSVDGCSICGGGKPVYCRGWCRMHYWRWQKYGSPYVTINRPPGLTLLETFQWYMPGDPPDDSSCWLWSGGAFSEDGYGLVGFEGKMLRAHVISYRLFIGDVPDTHLIRHRCDTPPCVHPLHLLSGTTLDNMRDKVARQRQSRGSALHTSRLTGGDVVAIRHLYETGVSQTSLAERYGVSQSSISALVLRKTWKHV